jgi:homoprotocatechuate degradation regulator HpaR
MPDAPLRDFSRSLPMLLLRGHQAVMAQFRPILRRHGITEQQWRVLRALGAAEAAGPVRIGRLADMTLISKPSLSRILRTLERRRLIRRSVPAEDQRAAQIALAAAGRRLIGQVAPHSERRYRQIAERIGEDSMATLYDVLPKLAHCLDDGAANGDPAPAPAPAG